MGNDNQFEKYEDSGIIIDSSGNTISLFKISAMNSEELYWFKKIYPELYEQYKSYEPYVKIQERSLDEKTH